MNEPANPASGGLLRSCPACQEACLPHHRHCPACAADLGEQPTLLDGMLIARKYRLRELLGEGGMAAVYLADQLNLGRTVAIKVLRASLAADPALVERFTDEARTASQLNHPHIVSIMDFGQTEAGLLYIVMEHLRGQTLARLIAARAPMPAPQVVPLLAQVLDALVEAHGQGVVHRDLKPENIMVEALRTGGDFAKVLDFGIAKLRPEQRSGQSLSGICGTPEYMAPEQVRAESDLDGRADLYSLGVVAFEMLTGVSPFAADSAVQILERQLSLEPPSVSEVRPEALIPPALDEVIRRALAKDRDARFASAAEMRAALDGCLPQRGRAQPRRPSARADANAKTLLAPRGVGKDPIVLPRPEQARLAAAAFGPPGATLCLRGPDGSGKSTLIAELRAEAERNQRALVVIGPDPLGSARPWYPIRQLCRRLLGLRGRPTLDMIDEAMARISQPQADLPGLAMMFGLGGEFGSLEHAARRRECFASTLRVVRHAAGHHQAVVVFEDVDRFDAPSRAIVERLLDEPASAPLTVIATATARFAPPAEVETLDLAPFSPAEVAELASALPDLDAAIVTELHHKSAGLPLHVDQLLRRLAEGGTPPLGSLEDTIADRVASLPPGARNLVETLALAGGQADAALLEGIGVSPTGEAVALAERRGFLTRAHGRLALSHPLLFEVIRERVPEEAARATHGALYEYLSARQAKPTLLAPHAYAGGQPAAIEVLEQAGRLAQHEFDDAGAAVHYRRAVELARWRVLQAIPDAEIELVRTSIALGEALLYSGDPAFAEAVLREALEHAATRPALEARVRLALSRLAVAMDRLEAAERELRAGWRSALHADAALIAELYLEFASLCMRRGDLKAAVQDLDEGISLCTGGEGGGAKDGPQLLWRLVARQAEALLKFGDRARALRVARFALEHARRAGTPVGEARVLALLGELFDALGDADQADESRQAALAIFRRLGDRKSTAEILLADAQVALGRASCKPDTLPRLEEAARLAAQVNWREGIERSAKVVDQVVRQTGSAPPS